MYGCLPVARHCGVLQRDVDFTVAQVDRVWTDSLRDVLVGIREDNLNGACHGRATCVLCMHVSHREITTWEGKHLLSES